jgi:hypothetical protein
MIVKEGVLIEVPSLLQAMFYSIKRMIYAEKGKYSRKLHISCILQLKF